MPEPGPERRAVYESDAQMRPDLEFVPAGLDRLVAGNRGRLLDARRTPITVVGVSAHRGSFSVRVDAFEDAGATWELFLGEIGRFQFERDTARAPQREVDDLQESLTRFDRELEIESSPRALEESRMEIGSRREEVRGLLAARPNVMALDVGEAIRRREGDPALYGFLESFLESRGIDRTERDLLTPLVSNPRSGEMVKGHAIVLAELGFCSYRGPAARDPDLFMGDGSKESRREHILWRMALTQAVWSGFGPVPLFRAAATEGVLRRSSHESIVSATFSKDVADSHFEGGPTTRAAMLMRQDLPLDRLLMTFLETRALNDRFREAEAVLIGSDAGSPF
jgi:hypothetical protein